MNVELLREVQKAILAEPASFDMDHWGFGGIAHSEALIPKCNSTCCIGGWAAAIYNAKLRYGQRRLFFTEGEIALGLTDKQETELFYASFWPEPYRSRYEAASTATMKARVASDRINAFIREYGSV